MHDESQLFFDSDKGGPNINEAFNSLTEDSRVRLEWFGDSNDYKKFEVGYSMLWQGTPEHS